MNCLEQNRHTPGNLLQYHKYTTDAYTHYSFNSVQKNCASGEFYATLSVLLNHEFSVPEGLENWNGGSWVVLLMDSEWVNSFKK